MSRTPPLLAHETFVRVLRVARFDGLSVLWVAGFFALLAAADGDFRGAVVGLIIAAAGAIELHGVAVLRHGEPRGVSWLVGSQIFLLLAMLGFCALQLTHFDVEPMRAAFERSLRLSFMRQMWEANQQQTGITETQFIRQTYALTYLTLAFVSLIYQGGMATYYLRRREPVTRALADE